MSVKKNPLTGGEEKKIGTAHTHAHTVYAYVNGRTTIRQSQATFHASRAT